MAQANLTSRSHETFTSLWAVVSLATISGVAALALGMLPVTLLSGEMIYIGAVVTAFAVLLCFGLGASVRHAGREALTYRLTLLIWWYVLVCEVVFDRLSDTQHTYQGIFDPQAWGEGITWVLAFLVLLVLWLGKTSLLRELFAGSYKWV